MGLASFAEEDKVVGSEAGVKGCFFSSIHQWCFPPLFFLPLFVFEVDENITDKEYKQYVPFLSSLSL